MKKFVLFILIVAFILSCQDEITVQIEKEPGSITGQVLPEGMIATVELYQGSLIRQTQTDAEGYFKLRDVSAGTYRLRVSATHYGSREFNQIHVEEGEGYDLGVIELSQIPYPLNYTTPYDGQVDVSVSHSDVIRLDFDTPMDLESVKNAFSIFPQVENIMFRGSTPNPRYGYYYIRISGEFRLGTEYEFTIDSTAETISGENLEFSYTCSFRTEYFKIINFSHSSVMYGNSSIQFVFNNEVSSGELLENMTITPSIAMNAWSQIERYQSLSPVLSWIPDTTFSITISSNLQDQDGNSLEGDTTFSFRVEPLKIMDTNPYHNQHFVPVNYQIEIRMNNLIDEGTILDATTIVPPVNYDITTYYSSGISRFYLIPDSLMATTQYTVTIDTSLKDYYGGNLQEPYSFSFVTQ